MKKHFAILSIIASIQLCIGQGTLTPVKIDSLSYEYGFYEYLPKKYDDNDKDLFPLVLFLHGAGERGNGKDELDKVLKNEPALLIKEGRHFEALFIMPQVEKNDWWRVPRVHDFLNQIIENYRIDTSRIYLTGLSMGGAGTWHYAQAYGERLAAVVPVCGAKPVTDPTKFIDLPVWAFHNDNDPKGSTPHTINSIDLIKKAGGNPLMTIYDADNHNAWTAAYNTQEMWDWMFSQPRPPHGIVVNKVTWYNTPVQNKIGEKIQVRVSVSDTNGSIDTVYADMSNLNGGNKMMLIPLGNDTYKLDHTLSNQIDAGFYPITIYIVDDEDNLQEKKTGVFVTESAVAPGNSLYSFYINMNSGENAPSPWNNMDADPKNPVKKTGFTSDKGLTLPFTVETASTWGGENKNGTLSGDDSGVFPDTVMKTTWWVKDGTGHLDIKGLPLEFNYTITTTGSRYGTDNRTSTFKVNDDSVTFDAADNTNQKAVFENIVPNISGAIRITLSKTPESMYAYMCGIQLDFIAKKVTPVPDDTSTDISLNHNNTDQILPNPFGDHIVIKYSDTREKPILYRMVDVSGTMAHEWRPVSTRTNTLHFDKDIPKGIYILQVIRKTSISSYKIMKE